jgi:hypothetical protein
MADGALYILALSLSNRPAASVRAASRNFQGRQHSRRQYGSDQFAIVHFQPLPPLRQNNATRILPLPRELAANAEWIIGGIVE